MSGHKDEKKKKNEILSQFNFVFYMLKVRIVAIFILSKTFTNSTGFHYLGFFKRDIWRSSKKRIK